MSDPISRLRRCASCPTVLSRYNDGDFCSECEAKQRKTGLARRVEAQRATTKIVEYIEAPPARLEPGTVVKVWNHGGEPLTYRRRK